MQHVSTFDRLERVTQPFRPEASTRRRLASPGSATPFAEEIALRNHLESSVGDTMHKLVFVASGLLDVEGAMGGWLILPNHMIFIPAERAFTIRVSGETTLYVAHLHPADAEWFHHGCWITAAPQLAKEMLLHALRWQASECNAAAQRLFFRTLSHLCQEWFATPRVLWLPIAESDEVKAAIIYVRNNLDEASLEAAAAAAGCSPRTLQRRCKDEFGHSWRWFSREVRIMLAMELLAHRNCPVNTVSRATGFASVAAFTASFSNRVGMSPSEFARRMTASPRSSAIAGSSVPRRERD